MTITFASTNKHKALELSSLLQHPLLMIDSFEVEEDGATLLDNALLKAKACHKITRGPVLADDSGLFVRALPYDLGVQTARFGGENLTQYQRNLLLLKKMKNIKDRYATFTCCLLFFLDDNNYFIVSQSWVGEIKKQLIGDGGFGYDPLFYLPTLAKTASQLTMKEKCSISHRGKAAKIMSTILTTAMTCI